MGNLGSTDAAEGGRLTQKQIDKYRNALYDAKNSHKQSGSSSKRNVNDPRISSSLLSLPETIDDEQIQELRENFAMFDLNGSGWIEFEDLKEALAIIGQPNDNYHVRKLLKSVDLNTDGRISFDEYIEWNRQLFIDDMKSKFTKMDFENKKVIGKTDIKRFAMEELGYMATEEELDNLTYAMDYNGDGWINIEEFIIAMANAKQGQAYYVYNGELYRRKMKLDFKAIDKDGNGLVDIEELRQMANSLGYMISDEELTSLMAEMDSDNDGKIDFQEFVAHSVKLKFKN